ncbi:RNA-binding protein NOB1, putative [Plasmodium ovale curtisi]|uniref:RNA-binding protein NOB1, putative n=1 Tax=Plasmodium ovale curtisi TaxID=864141 RepID=A0A1A8VR66_PLAOA|nr:RNA-binding protein NOB1, putative [Plasmodium ovale curtisi]
MFFSDEINTFLDRETPGDDPFKSSYSLDVTLENFPNPFIHPSLCNRSGLKYSYICDPNKMLSRNIADKIEGMPPICTYVYFTVHYTITKLVRRGKKAMRTSAVIGV